MARSDDLKYKRRRYVEGLNNVIYTANYLANSIKSLNNAVKTQSSCFNVDDIPGGSNYLVDLLEKENNIHSNLVNNVIPGIRNIISNLDYNIAQAVMEESVK